MNTVIARADILRLQAYALSHPLAEAGVALTRHHFLDVHDRGSAAGIRVALSLNK
jgi:hypothetical protein